MSAQGKFGFYSHQEVLNAIPGYHESVEEYELLKQRCNAEIERNEQELTRKYVAFLDGQQDFPEPILRKRQKELQQMVDNSVLFRDRIKKWLFQAKDSLFAPHNGMVDAALAKVCVRMELAYAIDCDETKYRYINPAFGEDITVAVIEEVMNPVEEVPVVECAEDEIATDVENVGDKAVDNVDDTEEDGGGSTGDRTDDSSAGVDVNIVATDIFVSEKVETDSVAVSSDKEKHDSITVAADVVE